ncbi:MAG: methyltransferase [Acidimicrobiales bacterium]|nr:methyltransferase [Acidimicrobiales bacterium]
MSQRSLTIEEHFTAEDRRAVLEHDARVGLTASQKRLSPIWFYDERGSALFDEITRLPEYYPTRAERGLLESAATEVVELARADTLVELGSGTSEKTRVLLDALVARGSCRYVPLDVDPDTLLAAATALTEEYPGLDVHAVAGDFLRHLDLLPQEGRRLVAFLGSTLGNLMPAERHRFFTDLDSSLSSFDRLLLGVDLVKDRARLEAAYDDAAGVTAEFNRNALRVVNRELDADFDPAAFDHVARWVPEQRWIEMRLRARSVQVVRVAGLDLVVHFDEGEELLTEISAKFSPDGIAAELWDAGFVVERTWQAGDDDFLLVLAKPYC